MVAAAWPLSVSSNTCRRRVTGRRTVLGRHASAPLPGTRPSGSLQPRGCPRGRGGLACPSRHLQQPVLHSSETRSHLSASRSPTGTLGPWWLRAGPPATLTGTEPGAIPRFRSKPVGAAGPALMSSSNARDGNGRSAVLCRDAPAFTQTQRRRAERPGNDSPRIRLLLFPCRSTTFLSQVTTRRSMSLTEVRRCFAPDSKARLGTALRTLLPPPNLHVPVCVCPR